MNHSVKWYTAHSLQSKTAVKVPDTMNQSSVLSDAVVSAIHTCLTWRSLKPGLPATLLPPEGQNDMPG